MQHVSFNWHDGHPHRGYKRPKSQNNVINLSATAAGSWFINKLSLNELFISTLFKRSTSELRRLSGMSFAET
ncbi:hypothetical protein GCM10011382_25200 [Vreelandella lutescens]|uniref:Uncharacterized protein n=1 Tax=Vreelandella lutescens TaxID=1602943 RepID=A0ABQ1PB70_9GAMM|nr:hypothetical protein GCM10011382_25200 [Halomonas lutescens]